MAVLDLYTPRINVRQQESEFRRKLLVGSLQKSAEDLFDYATKMAYNKRAFAGQEAEAAKAYQQLEFDREKMQHEEQARKLSTTAWTIANAPEMATPQMVSDLEQQMRDFTGSPVTFQRDQQGNPIIPDNLKTIFKVGFLDDKGMPNLEGFKTLHEINKPYSDLGQAIADYQNLRNNGLASNSPEAQGLMKKILDLNNFPDPVRRIINKDIDAGDWDGAWDKVVALKQAGAARNTNEFKVLTPNEQAEERLVIAGQVKTKLQEVQAAWDKVKTKMYSTGMGAETLNNALSYAGYGDPDLTELHRRVNEFQGIQLRLMAGLNMTANEERLAKSYLVNNQIPMSQFDTALKLNQSWADQNYNDRWFFTTVLGRAGEKGGIAVPPTPSPPQDISKPSAAQENQGTPPLNQDPSLKASQAEQERLRQKGRQRTRRQIKPTSSPPGQMSPQSQLFLRSLDQYNATV